MTLREIDIEERHHVYESGKDTWVDVHVPEHADTVSPDLVRYVWHEFGVDLADDEYGLEVEE